MTTYQLIDEIRRTIAAMHRYDQSEKQWPCPEHAAAMRASLDLTKALAAWRKRPAGKEK